MAPIVSIRNLTKSYASGFQALKGVNLDIEEGEILALLGPNGAGKTTMISIICGIVTPSGGSVTVAGGDILADYRKTRSIIGLVPQELTLDAFETVWNTVAFSRGLHGCSPDPALIERILRELSLYDKKDTMLRHLSGGMRRRVLIAKALSYEPKVLFLDEPTAGVDVSLRKDMWQLVERLLVEDKKALMAKLGRKQMTVELAEPLPAVPDTLSSYGLTLSEGGERLVYEFDSSGERTGISSLLSALSQAGLRVRDISTEQSSLEDIFVELVGEGR